MRLYKIGYGTSEESEYTELMHEKLFTHKQISKLIAGYISEYIATSTHTSMYQDVHCEVIRWLIAEQGFKPVEYDVKWDISGWANLFYPNGDEDDENITIIRKKLKDDGYTIWKDPMHASDCWTDNVMYRLAPRIWEKWI